MAHERIKTEMHGTGGGRWCARAVAKEAANRGRRCEDADATEDGLAEHDADIDNDRFDAYIELLAGERRYVDLWGCREWDNAVMVEVL